MSTPSSPILNPPDLSILPGIPREAEGPLFREPWEAQAFAIAVHLRDTELGVIAQLEAILAARFQDPTDPLTKALPCNIDHFGFNVTQSGTPAPCENSKDGVTPHVFRVWDVTHTPPAWVNWTNRTPNDYGEKLAAWCGHPENGPRLRSQGHLTVVRRKLFLT